MHISKKWISLVFAIMMMAVYSVTVAENEELIPVSVSCGTVWIFSYEFEAEWVCYDGFLPSDGFDTYTPQKMMRQIINISDNCASISMIRDNQEIRLIGELKLFDEDGNLLVVIPYGATFVDKIKDDGTIYGRKWTFGVIVETP